MQIQKTGVFCIQYDNIRINACRLLFVLTDSCIIVNTWLETLRRMHQCKHMIRCVHVNSSTAFVTICIFEMQCGKTNAISSTQFRENPTGRYLLQPRRYLHLSYKKHNHWNNIPPESRMSKTNNIYLSCVLVFSLFLSC